MIKTCHNPIVKISLINASLAKTSYFGHLYNPSPFLDHSLKGYNKERAGRDL